MSRIPRRGTTGPKRLRQFDKIEEYKERFHRTSSAELQRRLTSGSLIKKAAVAMRAVLKERGL